MGRAVRARGVVINVLVTRDGATVFFRGPNVPWAGQLDFTLEALVYGGVLGLRILAIFGSAVFLTAAVDPDELLRALRRVSLRSGVTAALAMRLFGVLRRDAARLADAQRCLPGGGASRLAGPARGHDRRAGPRDRRRGDARGARLRRRRAPAADAAALVAPRLRVRRLARSRCSRSRAGVLAGALGRSSTPTRASTAPLTPRDADRDRRAVRRARCSPFADRRGIGR